MVFRPAQLAHPFVDPLASAMHSQRDRARAVDMAKYMKDKFAYYGVPAPKRKAILAAHLKQYPLKDWQAEIRVILGLLWRYDEREMQYHALDILPKVVKKQNESFFDFLTELMCTKAWWDTVDMFSRPMRILLDRYPDHILAQLNGWINSDNIWLQRQAIIMFRFDKDQQYWDLVQRFIRIQMDNPNFFVRKGIGWALRSYAKHYPRQVVGFVSQHALSPLSKREALKNLNTN